MNRRVPVVSLTRRWFLLALPLAAWVTGESVDPPVLREPLPEKTSCSAYAEARREYLLAYAYMYNDPSRAQTHLQLARARLSSCGSEASVLSRRLEEISRH